VDIFNRAKEHLESHTFTIENYTDFVQAMEETRGFILSPWCGSDECETKVKDETSATVRVIPRDQPATIPACVVCGKTGKFRVVFAKSY